MAAVVAAGCVCRGGEGSGPHPPARLPAHPPTHPPTHPHRAPLTLTHPPHARPPACQVYDYAMGVPGVKLLSDDAPRLLHLPSFLSPGEKNARAPPSPLCGSRLGACRHRPPPSLRPSPPPASPPLPHPLTPPPLPVPPHAEEVHHFITVSKDHLTRSEVLSADANKTVDEVRTSFGECARAASFPHPLPPPRPRARMPACLLTPACLPACLPACSRPPFLPPPPGSAGVWPPQDEVVRSVQERIHRTVGVPTPFGEGARGLLLGLPACLPAAAGLPAAAAAGPACCCCCCCPPTHSTHPHCAPPRPPHPPPSSHPDIYVLNYKQGQRYEAHNDHCMDRPDVFKTADEACKEFLHRSGGPACGPGSGGAACGDRVATFILVFKSPDKGGATVFPEARLTHERVPDGAHAADSDWYCKAEGVLGVRPAAGDALMFWDYKPGHGPGTGSYADGDARSQAQAVYEALHSGCPVVEGEKWIGTRWIRSAEFI